MGKLGLAFRCFFRVLTDKNFAQSLAQNLAENTQKETSLPQEALQLLTLLQEEGRFIDFLNEDIDNFEDEQIGAAVRNIHANCKKVLGDLFELIPVLKDQEGQQITVSEGFDPREIKLVGKISGKPPFQGELKHHGWKVKTSHFPKGLNNHGVIAPAEVEIG